MKLRTTSIVLVAAVAVASGFAFMHDDLAAASARVATAGPVQHAPTLDVPGEGEGEGEDETDQALPADHPAIDHGAAAATAGGNEVAQPSDLPPALTWKAPASWPTAPSPSAIRIETRKVPRAAGDTEDAELSVARAGGDVEANVQRWVDQFDGTGNEKRAEKTVRGFKVTIVELEGTYQGGMGAASAPHPAWGLLGAIVEVPEQAYFFKVTGPAATVRAARAGFDGLIGSIGPSGR